MIVLIINVSNLSFFFLVTSAECLDYRSYMSGSDQWLLIVLSAIIYFIINCFLDSYLLRKWLSKVLFTLEIIYYKHIKKTFAYEKGNDGTTASPVDKSRQETLSAEKLFKSYSGKTAVNNINLKLNKQECLGILGVNGAGKTTTFRMLTRDECLDNGRVNLTVDEKIVDIGKDKVCLTLTWSYLLR